MVGFCASAETCDEVIGWGGIENPEKACSVQVERTSQVSTTLALSRDPLCVRGDQISGLV